jgi:uncharacterized membrane protein
MTQCSPPVATDAPGPRQRVVARLTHAREQADGPFWRHAVPLTLLACVVMYWLSDFVPRVIDQQRNYATYDYDLGIFDQTTWLLAHGRGFITLRGLPFLGHHLNLGLILFAPAYWLGAGPELLNVAMTVAMAACVVPLAAICHRYRPTTSWYALAFGFTFLYCPVTQDMLVDSFYPEKMAMPFMLGALWAAMERRWRLFAVCAVLTVVWKEDLALFVMMLGLGVAVKRDRRIGAITVGLAAAYFVIATRVVLAHFAGGGAFYAGFLGPLGGTPGELLHNLFTEPSLFTDRYNANDGTGYVVELARQWVFTPLLSPSSLLLALPSYVVNVLSSQGYTQELHRHYVTVPFVASAYSSVRGALSRRTVAIRAGLAVGLIAMSVWTHNAGAGPWSSEYETGIWGGLVRLPRHDVLDRAVAMVPEGASVSASYRLASHLSRRPEVYTFPNPWVPYNWGIEEKHPRSPLVVDWLVIDRGDIAESPERVSLFASITASPCWVTVMNHDDIVVAHRTTSRTCRV